VVATPVCRRDRSNSSNTSAGVFQPRTFLGLLFIPVFGLLWLLVDCGLLPPAQET